MQPLFGLNKTGSQVDLEHIYNSFEQKEESSNKLTVVESTYSISQNQTFQLRDFIEKLNELLNIFEDTKGARFEVEEHLSQMIIELFNHPKKPFSRIYYGLKKSTVSKDFIEDFFNYLDNNGYSFASELKEEFDKKYPSEEKNFLLGDASLSEKEECEETNLDGTVYSDTIDFTKPNFYCNFNLECVVIEISFVLSSFNFEPFENLSFGIVGDQLCFRFGEGDYFFKVKLGELIPENEFKQLFILAMQESFHVNLTDLLI